MDNESTPAPLQAAGKAAQLIERACGVSERENCNYFKWWEWSIFLVMLLLRSFWKPLDWEDKAPETNRAGLSGAFPGPTFLVLRGRKHPYDRHFLQALEIVLRIKPLLSTLNTEGLSEFQVWPCWVSHINFTWSVPYIVKDSNKLVDELYKKMAKEDQEVDLESQAGLCKMG